MKNETNSNDLPEITEAELSTLGDNITDFSIDLICGFLRVISGSRTDTTVEATANGCFRWVFSNNAGRVTSISAPIRMIVGQRERAYTTNGNTVGINCDCR